MKSIIRQLYYFFYDLFSIFRNINADHNFIIIIPRILSLVIKKVFIYDKINKKIFIQRIRDKYDILTVYEIFSIESYNLKKLKIWKKISQEYQNYQNNKLIPLIIDCGSNIGCSTEYFQRIFKESYTVLIEPEEKNFNFSNKNLSNKDNKLMNCVVADEEKNYFFEHDFIDSRAPRVTENQGTQIKGITVNQILSDFPKDKYQPFLIKIDIEGFEDQLFSKNYEWINKFDIIIIEIHDWMLPGKSNSHNFINALNQVTNKNNKRDLIISGENLISIKLN